MEMTKEILIEYCELRQEAADLRLRIERDQRRLSEMQEKDMGSQILSKEPEKMERSAPLRSTGFLSQPMRIPRRC